MFKRHLERRAATPEQLFFEQLFERHIERRGATPELLFKRHIIVVDTEVISSHLYIVQSFIRIGIEVRSGTCQS